jgi:hypothetical protein
MYSTDNKEDNDKECMSFGEWYLTGHDSDAAYNAAGEQFFEKSTEEQKNRSKKFTLLSKTFLKSKRVSHA